MAVKNYYILAFQQRVTMPFVPASEQPHFLGKTVDLSFRTEPEKTLDLDDGTTEVGSEKLSLTFSILGAIDNPWPIAEIWLVPMIGSKLCPDNGFTGMHNREPALRVFLTEYDEYRFETKSGDFETSRFSCEIRYPVQYEAYEYVDIFKLHNLHLFPNIQNNDDDIRVRTHPGGEYIAHMIEDRMMANHVAIISRFEPFSNQIIFGGDIFKEIAMTGNDELERGVFIHAGMLNSAQLAIRNNLQSVYSQAQQAYKDEANSYAVMYSAKFGGSPSGFRIFELAMHKFAQDEPWANLATLQIGDMRMLFPELTSIADTVEAGYLPALPGAETMWAEL
jgi:hypothetical protein